MVIKVVGNDPSITKRVTCRNCGNILEYVPADEIKTVSRDYGGGNDVRHHINCPCGKAVTTKSY